MEAQRKLLDSLMGKDRNGNFTRVSTKHFTDSDVCKFYLCGLCPKELFANTKMDDGECHYKHSDVLRQDYEEAVKKGQRFPYEEDLMITLENLVSDCDRRIDRAKQRIQNTPSDKETANKAQAVQEMYEKAQQLGEEGKIQESEELLRKAEEMKRQQDEAENSTVQPATQQEKLRVCEVCSAFLSVYDSNRRLADHFGGKLHIGFLQVRDRVKELKEKYPNGSTRTFSDYGRRYSPERRRYSSPERRPYRREYDRPPPRDDRYHRRREYSPTRYKDQRRRDYDRRY